MRIEKLELKNFRSHQVTQYMFDRVNVVRGYHGAGKSSIALAIEFLLTGACAVTDTAGRGADQLLMDGADEFVIKARIGLTSNAKAAGAVMQRSRNKAGGNFMIQAGADKKKNFVSRQADAWIEEKIAPRPVLLAVLNAQRFFQMTEKERKQLLTSALAADPVPLPGDVQKHLAQFIEDAPTQINSPDDADFYHKQLYELRREKKAARAAMGALEEPEKPEGMPSASETRQRLAKVREELTELEQERATALANHGNLLRDFNRAKSDLEEHQPAILNDETMKELTRQASKKDAAVAHDKQINEKLIAIQSLKNQMDELGDAPTNCPTCGHALDKSATDEKINNLQHRSEIAQKELEELQQKRKALGTPTAAEQQLAAHRRAIPKVAAAEKIIAEYKGIQETVDTSEIDAQIKPLKDKIEKGESVLTRINMFDGEMARYRQELEQRKALDERLTLLEGLVKYFGADGELRPLLVGNKLTGFNDAINKVLERFEFSCVMNLEPFGIVVTTGAQSAQPRQLDQLSESEAFRFGVAFQIALAEATGVKLVVIDRADLLLPGVQRFLNAALMESDLDQAFILAAKEDLELKQLPPTGVKIFDLEKDGKGRTDVAEVHEAEKEAEYVPE